MTRQGRADTAGMITAGEPVADYLLQDELSDSLSRWQGDVRDRTSVRRLLPQDLPGSLGGVPTTWWACQWMSRSDRGPGRLLVTEWARGAPGADPSAAPVPWKVGRSR